MHRKFGTLRAVSGHPSLTRSKPPPPCLDYFFFGKSTPKGKSNKTVDRTRSSAAQVVALAGARSPKSSMSSTQTWIRGTCKETAEKFDVSEEDCVQVSVVRESCRSEFFRHCSYV
ncbi:BZ3500_MvSof-1268-A1-R1_Chr12-1g03657 [Microbotryum saponariae]|uniref:BZ3500_MvSof-1268-A1-R1_Chr12-1g03657 protein n=1 Tax=Microbotryum saponariae TaxID=289078 RepID=A0A2X0MS62_9BASI|nr:BZ3500_MvSof-1268-A1-R1_Chr12-1g03657 [Microbotryum saponariae]